MTKYIPDWAFEDDNDNVKVDVPKLGDFLLEKNEFVWAKDKGSSTLLHFNIEGRNAGLWDIPSDKLIANLVAEELSNYKLWSYRDSRDTQKYINERIDIVNTDETFDNINPKLIHFHNGVFDIDHPDQLRTHDDRYYMLNGRDYDIINDPNIKPVVTEKWLLESLGGQRDALSLFETLIGYTFYAGWINGFNTFQILKGNGGEGKSRILNYIASLIGFGATSNLPFETVTGNASKFDISELHYKLMNYYADINSDYVSDLALLKLLTGKDRISASQKYKGTADFQPYAKMWFAGNHLPRVGKIGEAEHRRAKIFTITKLTGNELTSLYREDDIKKERGSFAYWCLVRFILAMRAKALPDCKMVENNWKEWLNSNDNVQQWIDACCSTEPTARDSSANLYKSYKDFCAENGLKYMSRPKLVESLKQHGFEKKNSIRIKNSVKSGFIGIHATEEWIKADY